MLGASANLEPWIIPARLKTSYFSVSVKDVLFSLVVTEFLYCFAHSLSNFELLSEMF